MEEERKREEEEAKRLEAEKERLETEQKERFVCGVCVTVREWEIRVTIVSKCRRSFSIAYNPKKSKKFPSIFGHPEGRGRATPIIWQRLKLGILSKFLLHQVAYNQQKKIGKICRAFLVTLRGVAGPYPFSAKVKVVYFSKFFLHRVAYNPKKAFFGHPQLRPQGPHPFLKKIKVVVFSKLFNIVKHC